SIPFIAIYFSGELDMSMTEIGIFFGAMAIVRSLFQAVGGELSDRMDRRDLLIVSQFARSLAFVVMGLAVAFDWGFWPIALGMTFNSIFGAMFMPAINALVSDILPKVQRLDGYAITRAAGNFGWAAGPAMGGFFAHNSYATLFYISAVITAMSAVVFLLFFKSPTQTTPSRAFSFRDLAEVRKDSYLARHCLLTLALYLVVAQLVAPLSVYTVEMVGITESQLGWLFAINGAMVTVLQLPVTRLLSRWRFTSQLAVGGLLYFIGYGVLGLFTQYSVLALLIVVITVGEITMSPPSMTLTSRLAPDGRMGRYMGIYGFFMASGWSLGPMYGGYFLDHYGNQPELAWLLISSLAVVSSVGYWLFGRSLPDEINLADNVSSDND
ncbi:MFS transporter, partial [candidate division GN15 bacterium]|nr:MFS transporter [candidate division GN15 bacterium]